MGKNFVSPPPVSTASSGSDLHITYVDVPIHAVSLLRVLHRLAGKHSFEPNHLTPAKRDPSLTIEDIAGKVKIWEKLLLILLPSIQDQLTLLLNSLDLIDPEKNPIPVANATLEILSNLDKTLESTVSAVVSLTLESPLADKNHDHDLQKLKAFQCSYLQERIKLLVESYIYYRLFRYLLPLFIQWCAIADITVEDDLKEGSDLRERIQATISYCNKMIARTILWCQRSDWTIIHVAWIGASVTVDDVLETLTCRTNCTTQSTPAANSNNNEQTSAKTDLIFVAAQSAIPLVNTGYNTRAQLGDNQAVTRNPASDQQP
ncbi:hypothetical protein PTTG_27042 [Puccinia triticina 1-1 BBBD Race 1]|uniref:Uncharacterized protein n=1 Tax=Puccinia triticina (isolate 1-1 / race 1 (BBBD)) TaxID=630390 RepID=A0A180GNM7_PUCT1|nr:hypothetical protein PTTG_27042 [Puccinia triticina 1-1 BBBD Race 1]